MARTPQYVMNPSGVLVPLQGDLAGRLLTSLSQIGGQNVTLDTLNNLEVSDFIKAAILAGKAFTATTGKQTSAGAVAVGTSLFNPIGSGKTFYVFSVRAQTAGSNQHTFFSGVTTDPAFGTGMTVANIKNGAGIASVASATFANAASTFSSGLNTDLLSIAGNVPTDFLASLEFRVVPAGTGIGALLGTSTNVWGATYKWVEL